MHSGNNLVSYFLSFLLFNAVLSQSIVKSLPGYDGHLPFKLETGYVGVGKNEEVQLFYYFIESESDPMNDPLMLWLTGGPGCSAFSGLVYEIGPLIYDLEAYDGGFPSLLLNPYSWTKAASIIFLDSPVGTGFSYSNTTNGSLSSDTKAVEDIYKFLQKWLWKHRMFLKNRLYISGDSYAGIWVPMVAWKISQGNDAGVEPNLRLEGYMVGNPYTDLNIDGNAKVPFAHRLALISDKYFQMAKSGCNGNYVKPDTSNTLCALALQHYTRSIRNIFTPHVLEPVCRSKSQTPLLISRRNVLEDESRKILLPVNQQQKEWCRSNNYKLVNVWANDPSVQEALRVRKGTTKEWRRCRSGSLSYDENVESVIQYHRLLSRTNYKALVYSGDHDMLIPYIGTLKWIYNLNLTLDDDWRDWNVDDQVAGYTQRFKQDQSDYHLTFATVKGAGHTAPEYKPKECLAMVERFLSSNPL